MAVWRKALKIHEVQEPLNVPGRDALLRRQPIDARRIHGDVTRNRRMMEGRFLPGQESMAEVHDRHAREVKRGDQCLEVMVTVDEIWCEAHLVQIADDGHCGGAQFSSNFSEGQAERDGPMASANQRATDIAHPELRPGPLGQCVVSEEDREGSHEARQVRQLNSRS